MSIKPALFIYFDGSFKQLETGNMGAIGFYIKEQGGDILYEHKMELKGIETNTEAEYKSLKIALKSTYEKYSGNNRIFVFGDEKTIINQFEKDIEIEGRYEDLIKSIHPIINKFDDIIFSHISQSENKKAHNLSNSVIKNYN